MEIISESMIRALDNEEVLRRPASGVEGPSVSGRDDLVATALDHQDVAHALGGLGVAAGDNFSDERGAGAVEAGRIARRDLAQIGWRVPRHDGQRRRSPAGRPQRHESAEARAEEAEPAV